MSSSDNDRAGDLLIQEVDEELRREQYELLWKRYGHWAIGAALAVILIVAGYQGWQRYQADKRRQEAAALTSAQELVVQGKTAEAAQAFLKLADGAHDGTAVEARMRAADLLSASGDKAAAAAALDAIAKSSAPSLYRDLAVIKSALLALESGDAAALLPRLTEVAAAGNPWQAEATEVLAMAALKKGDTARAIDLFKQLSDDAQAPQALRARAAEMLAALSQPTKG